MHRPLVVYSWSCSVSTLTPSREYSPGWSAVPSGGEAEAGALSLPLSTALRPPLLLLGTAFLPPTSLPRRAIGGSQSAFATTESGERRTPSLLTRRDGASGARGANGCGCGAAAGERSGDTNEAGGIVKEGTSEARSPEAGEGTGGDDAVPGAVPAGGAVGGGVFASVGVPT
jgi:hypothetical protein